MSGVHGAAALVVILLAAQPAPTVAQGSPSEAGRRCFRARPAPECSAFFVTNAGLYVTPGTERWESPWRGVVDWGLMANTSSGHAIGGSWFVALDQDDFTTGPVLRYRRWLEGERSLDLAVGTPVAGNRQLQAGSLLGMVKYNPVHWFGFGVRPEYVRRLRFRCGPSTCTESTEASGRVYGGVEFGSVPGLALSLGSGLAFGVLIIVYVASGALDD